MLSSGDSYAIALVRQGCAGKIRTAATEADVLYELLLKYGLDLAVPTEQRALTDKTVYIIGAGALIASLSKDISLEVVAV
jgi:adenine-specific DNA-methyltransferase